MKQWAKCGLLVAAITWSASVSAAAQDAKPDSATPAPAHLRGVIVTDDTTEVIVGAEVILVGLDQSVKSDGKGRFDFGTLPPDSYIVQVRHIGYRPRGIKANLAPGSTLEIKIPLRREVAAQELTEVVSVAAVKGGFYDRMKSATLGSFLSRKDIELKHAAYAGELLVGIPGMRVRCGGAQCAIVNTRGSCTPAFFMNGGLSDITLFSQGNIQPDDIEGIEVYRGGSETPAQYSGVNSDCGAIILWTRTGKKNASR